MNTGADSIFIINLYKNAEWRKDDRNFFTQYHRKMRLREAFPDEFPTLSDNSEAIQMVICQKFPGVVLKSTFEFFGNLEMLLLQCSHSDERVRDLEKRLERDGFARLTVNASVFPEGGHA